jgi:superfamily II DNA/RNA helicase
VALSAVSRLRRPVRSDVFWSIARGERVRLTGELVSAAGRAVVFCRSAADATRVAGELSRHGVPAAAVEQRDFRSSRIRALVVTDETALSCPRNAAWCVIQFDPASTPRRYRRRLDLVAAPGAMVVSLVVPERRLDADRLLERLDADGVTPPDVAGIRPALIDARVAAERAASRRADEGSDLAAVAPTRTPRSRRNGELAVRAASELRGSPAAASPLHAEGVDAADTRSVKARRLVGDASGRAAGAARRAGSTVKGWSRFRRRSG